ncbi:MAG: peptidylprolyl isomerase [Verrucomicrobia bacterium]|nr:peptidylprolyl isomerase [Verrucomicrobiota bacterium]
MRIRPVLLSWFCAVLAFAQPPATPTPTLRPTATPIPTPTPIAVADVRVILKTDKGDIEMTIFASKAPVTAASFVNLAEKKFYDGKTFHRVIPGFMIQGGDPTGTGAGNPGYLFEDEFRPELRFNRAGLLAMANAGRGTNGSQFFITHAPTPHLNDRHTIFGEVTKGMEVVMDIKQGDKIRTIEVLDSSQPLLNALAPRVEQWNKLLKK